jgi:hypothetical protein
MIFIVMRRPWGVSDVVVLYCRAENHGARRQRTARRTQRLALSLTTAWYAFGIVGGAATTTATVAATNKRARAANMSLRKL